MQCSTNICIVHLARHKMSRAVASTERGPCVGLMRATTVTVFTVYLLLSTSADGGKPTKIIQSYIKIKIFIRALQRLILLVQVNAN